MTRLLWLAVLFLLLSGLFALARPHIDTPSSGTTAPVDQWELNWLNQD
jgi:hypothetical protein